MSALEPARRARAPAAALLISAVGLLLIAWGMLTGSRAAYFSYLAAYAYWLSLALCGLLFIMIQHAMSATWFIVLRRLAEAASASLLVLAILFLPLLSGLRELYPWVQVTGAGNTEFELLMHDKRAYLNIPFFLVRAALYFAAWLTMEFLLRHWSVGQREGDGPVLARRQRILSAGLLPIAAFTLTFAAIDWLMSLNPLWYSTVFGVYYFSGGVLGFLSLLALVVYLVQRAGLLRNEITVSHIHALGKLMLVFLIFWAYIAFVQLLLIWIADVPEESAWYVVRTRGGWGRIGLLLIIGHFAIPFLLLLSWRLKRSTPALAAVGAWLLVMHYAEIYWFVLPALDPEGPRPSLFDAAALAGIGGAAVAYAIWWFNRVPPVPLGDPRLESSLSFYTS